MSIKASSLLGAAVATLALLAPVATMAQAPRPDFPGAKQQEPLATQPDPAVSPRPDFPGAKQPDPGMATTPRSDLPGAKQGEAPSQK